MKRLFVIAIGGTGARVLRSLTMLMAAGEFSDREIVPIIVDFDFANGSVVNSIRALDCYNRINSAYSNAADKGNSRIFAAPVSDLAGHTSKKDWRLDLTLPDETHYLKDLLGYQKLSQENEATKFLLESLFGKEDNCTSQLNMDLCVGFKAFPNVSHIVYDYQDVSMDFNGLPCLVNPSTDEIVIVGSTFGGTGTSGICKFITKLKNFACTVVGCKLRTGVVLVEPYFNLEANPYSMVSSSTFDERSKAFLKYYQTSGISDSVQVTFHVGLKDRATIPFEGGGICQNNPAHYIELLSALAIKHFAENVSADGDQYLSFPSNKDGFIDIDDLLQSPYESTIKKLCSLAFTSYWLKNEHPYAFHHHNYEESRIPEFTKALCDFAENFIGWCNEMKTQRYNGLSLFNFDALAMDNIIVNHPAPQHSLLFLLGKRVNKLYRKELDRHAGIAMQNHQDVSTHMIINMLHDAGEKVVNHVLQ